MQFIQAMIRKLLLAIVAIAGVADVSGLDVPRLVAQTPATQAAASVSGTWEGMTGQGRQVSLLLKADGSALTGWLTLDRQSGAVKDGKIEKSAMMFAVDFAGRTLAFTGEVAGDEMTLRLEGARNPVTLKRVKSREQASRLRVDTSRRGLKGPALAAIHGTLASFCCNFLPAPGFIPVVTAAGRRHGHDRRRPV